MNQRNPNNNQRQNQGGGQRQQPQNGSGQPAAQGGGGQRQQPPAQQQSDGGAGDPSAEDLWGDYEDFAHEGEGGLYGEGDQSLNDDESVFWDTELNAVCAIKSMRTWISDSEMNRGTKWFKADLVVKNIIEKSSPHVKDDRNESRIVEGTVVTVLNELPDHPSPKMWDFKEKMNMDEAIGLGSAIVGLKKSQFNHRNLGQMCRDDGAPVKGRLIGVETEADLSEKEDRYGETYYDVYYNAKYYPVDQSSGRRVSRQSAEEVRSQQSGNGGGGQPQGSAQNPRQDQHPNRTRPQAAPNSPNAQPPAHDGT